MKEPSSKKIQNLIDNFQEKNFEKTEKLAESIIQEFPNVHIAWKILAIIYKSDNRMKKSIDASQRAIELNPEDFQSYNNIAGTYLSLGEIIEAEINYKKAISLNPNFSNAHHNLANMYNVSNKLEDSLHHYYKAIENDPKNANIYNNLGVTLNALKMYEKAEDALKNAINIKPNFYQALSNIAVSQMQQNKDSEAVSNYIKAVKINPDYLLALENLADALVYLKFETYNEDIEEILLNLLEKGNIINPSYIAGAILSVLEFNPTFKEIIKRNSSDDFTEPTMEDVIALSKIPLLIKFIENSYMPYKKIEKILKKIRKMILNNITEIENTPEILKFQIALSLHCFHNEYVYDLTEEEIRAIKKLEIILEKDFSEKKYPSSKDLACLSSYNSIKNYSWINLSKIPSDLEAIKIRQILEPIEEKKLKLQIPILEEISDSISSKVKAQYEENPYPRWTQIGLPKKPVSIIEFSRKRNLRIKDNSIKKIIEPNILIAGCGTGQHAIQETRFRDCKILAIDLSLSSLAYAKRKAKEFGVTNIEFMQADILDLKKLNRKFDIIQCCGVLHHMDDPLKGWRTLSECLIDDGLMRIALYSKIAREHISRIHSDIKYKNINTAKDKMMSYRNFLFDSNEPDHIRIMESADFYSFSMFRDLLFHEKEHQFTIHQIKNYIEKLNLSFSGFEGYNNESMVKSFKSSNPNKEDIYNLSKWHVFEKNNKRTFRGMYDFWCQKL